MDHPTLYDDDIVTWSEQQAAAVRALASRPDLSNALDWENVAEEIESVGRSQIQAVESLVLQLLVHLQKRASASTSEPDGHWRAEIATFQVTARNRYERSMRRRIDWQRSWASARELAAAPLLPFGDAIVPNLPETCPLSPEQLMASPFDIDAALASVVASAGPRRAAEP